MGYAPPPVPSEHPPAGAYRHKPQDTSHGPNYIYENDDHRVSDYGFHWPPWWHIVILVWCVIDVAALIAFAVTVTGGR